MEKNCQIRIRKKRQFVAICDLEVGLLRVGHIPGAYDGVPPRGVEPLQGVVILQRVHARPVAVLLLLPANGERKKWSGVHFKVRALFSCLESTGLGSVPVRIQTIF